ncbi:MAG: DUF4296 domain-containing protein [Flavobacteriales bacterium]|nr:DUF4296 domain-containing protein [Flavobacteriales bacterium]
MRTLFFICVLVLSACAGEEGPAPGTPPLDRETFVDALTGSYLIEARVNRERAVELKLDGPIAGYYDAMFAEKGITKEQFKATFDHYLERPEELQAIQEEVIARLSKEKDEAAQAR